MMIKYLLIALFPLALFSQETPIYRINNLSVLENSKYKTHAFSGGLNNVSFSQYDFNKDGMLDLYLYDNQSNKSLVYLHELVGGEHRYINNYDYESYFPKDLGYWALLRDYNCDNVLDLFSYEGTTIKVYKGKSTGGALSFSLINSFYTVEDTGTSTARVQIYTCGMPIIEDVNSDGYLDIIGVLSSMSGSTTFTYMKNETGTKGYPCDSFKLKVKSNCWGKLKVTLPLDYQLNQCGGTTTDGMSVPYSKINTRHCGSISAWIYDNDNDGDYEICSGEEFTNYTVYGHNAGHKDFANMDSVKKNFPDYNVPIPYKLPQGYWMDINNDGKKDMIVTTLINSGNIDNYLERDHISFYKNEPVGNISSFKLQQNDFIVGNSIDVGLGSYPVLFDYNGDSLNDLLVSNDKYYINDTNAFSCIFLYKNVGTKKAPKFEFVTDDLWGLRKYKLTRIIPSFGDLDKDGDLDMVFGDGKIGLHMAINQPVGKVANFDSVKLNYITLGSFSVNAAPYLFDFTGDGALDLMMGENNGLIYLMKNKGTLTNPVFDTVGMNRFFGKMSAKDSILEYYFDLRPTLAMDGKYIYVGNRLGNIQKYEWNKDSVNKGSFKRHSLSYFPYNSGNYASIAVGDINDDGKSDFFVGNIRGGLQLYTFKVFDNVLEKDIDTVKVIGDSVGVSILINESKTDWNIYPNPANNLIFIDGLEAYTDLEYEIYNLMMQPIKRGKLENNSIKLDLLENGHYFMVVKNKEIITAKPFVKIKTP